MVELCAYESKSEVARGKQGIVEVQPQGLRQKGEGRVPSQRPTNVHSATHLDQVHRFIWRPSSPLQKVLFTAPCSHSNLWRCLFWKKYGYQFLPTIEETHSLPHTWVFAVLYIIQNFLPLLECLPFTPFPKGMKPAQGAAMLGSRGKWF